MSILVGYVPTPVGEAALDTAIAEAKLRGEELLIVNSSRQGTLADKTVASPSDLKRLAEASSLAGIQSTVLQSSHTGDVVEEILDLARVHGVSLVVIGLRRRAQVGQFVMASVAQQVLLQADCPVLAVKPAQDS